MAIAPLPVKFHPKTPMQRTVAGAVIVNRFGDGYEQVFESGIGNHDIKISLEFLHLKFSDLQELETFFNTQRADGFLWRSPWDAAAVAWRPLLPAQIELASARNGTTGITGKLSVQVQRYWGMG